MSFYELAKLVGNLPQINEAVERIRDVSKVAVEGLFGSAKTIFLSAIIDKLNKPVLIVTASHSEAERIFEELKIFLNLPDIYLYPAPDTIPYEDISPSKELIGERFNILDKWSKRQKMIVVAEVKAVMYKTISKKALSNLRLSLSLGQTISRGRLTKKLLQLGYKRMEIVGSIGEFSLRGGIVDIYSSNFPSPIRLEFLGDKIESIRTFDCVSQRSTSGLKETTILPAIPGTLLSTPFDYLSEDTMVVLDEAGSLKASGDRLLNEAEEVRVSEKVKPQPIYISFEQILKSLKDRPVLELTSIHSEGSISLELGSPKSYIGRMEALISDLENLKRAGYKVTIVSKHERRLKEILEVEDILSGELSSGFILEGIKFVLLTDKEIFGERILKGRFKIAKGEGVDPRLLVDLKVSDYVVHVNWGIGIYKGLKRLKIEGAEQEYLLIEYAMGDKLYVPLYQMGSVQRYSGEEGYSPKIARLGGREWNLTKRRVKEGIADLTAELLDIYIARQREEGFSFPPDSLWQVELESSFPYEETPDQKEAIIQVKADMENTKPMDRLICGDVGYGKTEVGLRAAFKAATAQKQVAVLVPTTILAEQHYNTFKERLMPYPVIVEMLSRFKSKSEQEAILKGLSTGGIDIVIGTHRLLQKDVKFKDLGLLIIDEEQRFGVAAKERLKKLRKTVDVLTLTATPIPRTLYLALSHARDMSMIATPPLDRSPIRTHVIPWNDTVLREAVLKELERGGQVYFVYNYIQTIDKIVSYLGRLTPKARIAVAHGQMDERDLEKTMIDFMARKYDILLCTTIIESGLDIPNVNTIIIDHAEKFGLADLYQLRGRVGRGPTRAYAYLLYHPEEVLTETALERLTAIKEFSALGSGYKLALRDLEIRGAGNLLGKKQHGHMLSVGFDLYCELLEEVVRESRGIKEAPPAVTLDLKLDAYIPSDYIQDESQRISLYRRMSLALKESEIDDLIEEIKDRFGSPPKPLEILFQVLYLKVKAQNAGIKSIEGDLLKITIEFFDRPKTTIKIEGYPPDVWFKKLKEFVDKLS